MTQAAIPSWEPEAGPALELVAPAAATRPPGAVLEPLVLSEASAACGVDEETLARAVALALLTDGPDGAVPGWWWDAPCRGLDPDTFFPRQGQDTRPLQAMCTGCPVKPACLGSALFNGEGEGWWGGTSGNGRRRLRKVLRTAGVMGVTGEDAYLAWREDDRDPPDLAPPKYARHDPWPHQLEAVAAVRAALADGGRCQVAIATAAGKTHVALWSANALGVERVLLLVPSLSLIAQTADVWASDPRWAGAPRLAVCSDTGELELDATTDPKVVQEFMAGDGPRLMLGTYYSSAVVAAAGCRYDLTVADEAHHLAGEVDKAYAPVLRGEIDTDRTLFMTATPRRFGRRRRGAGADLVDMDADVFGPRVFDFTLNEAVAAGVVADYRVIVAAVARSVFERVAALPEMKGIDPHLLAGAIAVVRTMGELELGSCVSFHNRVDRARTFAQLVGTVAEVLDTRPPGHGWAGFVHGGASVRIRRRLLARLADPRSWGVVANARALGEGVDMPALDAVAIVDPRNSETDVMQATGRALRRPGTRAKVGTVLLPVLLADEPDPDDPLAGCDRRSMELVGGVLRALSAHDSQLTARLSRTRREMGEAKVRGRARIGPELRRRAARNLLSSRVELHVPGGATGELAGAMALHLVREATPSWEEAYGRLLGYVAEAGAIPGQATKVPDDTGTFSLGAWCTVQRTLRRRGLLGGERIAALEAVAGWSWEPRDEGWWEKLDALRDYMETHGRDPRQTEQWRGVWVGRFLNSCRAAMTDHDNHWLTQFPDRIAGLEAIPGWAWNAKDAQWDEGYAAVEAFIRQHRRLPTASDENLGRWCTKQRARLRAGALSQGRVDRLRALPGWVDDFRDVYEDEWEEGLIRLITFVEEHGRLPQQTESHDGFKVGTWAAHQRHSYVGSRARSTMTHDRTRRLEAVPGWSWEPLEDAWETRLAELSTYARRHHHAGRPLRLPTGPLGDWATGQRMAHSRGRLRDDRVAALGRVPGWSWSVPDAKLEAAVSAATAWLARTGPLDPPSTHREAGVALRAWIVRWRREEMLDQIDPALADRLEALPGWSWSPLPSAGDRERGQR